MKERMQKYEEDLKEAQRREEREKGKTNKKKSHQIRRVTTDFKGVPLFIKSKVHLPPLQLKANCYENTSLNNTVSFLDS